MPHEVKRFKCNYCKKTYSRIAGAAHHEYYCIHNPAQRACPTCLHDEREECFVGVRPSGVAMVRHCEQWDDREVEP